MSNGATNYAAADPLAGKPLVLFDGVCNLCNGSIRFILKRDRHDRFRFAPLESNIAQAYLDKAGLDDLALSSMVLVEDGHVYVRSDAALRISRHLHAAWPLLYAFIILPRFLRDGVYNFVARHRYAWFGKRSACMVPEPDVADRFIR